MIVSGSEISTLNECEMRYFYQFLLGLWPKDESAAIFQGKTGHYAGEQFFKAIQNGATKEEALQAMVPPAFDALTAKAYSLMTKFCEDFNVESGRPLLVEEQRVVPLEGRVKIGLTPDLVWQYNSGKVDLIDFKFSGRAWSQEASEIHYQLPSYRHYLAENFGIKADALKYIYFNTKNQAEDKYKIHRFTVTDAECEEVVRDQIKSLDRLIELRENPVAWSRKEVKRVNKVFACDYCPFKFPCRLGRKGQEKKEQQALDLMFTHNTYGYGEDFDE